MLTKEAIMVMASLLLLCKVIVYYWQPQYMVVKVFYYLYSQHFQPPLTHEKKYSYHLPVAYYYF